MKIYCNLDLKNMIIKFSCFTNMYCEFLFIKINTKKKIEENFFTQKNCHIFILKDISRHRHTINAILVISYVISIVPLKVVNFK